MKINKKILLGSSAAMVALSPLAAQQLRAASVSVPAQAIIQAAIDFDNTVGLDFGILTQTAAGTASVGFTNNLSVGGGVKAAGGTVATGSVDIKATKGQTLVISPNGLPFILSAGTKTMQITAVKFKYNAATGVTISPAVTASYTVGDALLVGATLDVGAAQTSGTYIGAVKVDVVYQ
jgi:hypothetical protein